jgi:hypothetical protein
MFIKKLVTSIFLFVILLSGNISYSQEILFENLEEISNYYMELINDNTIKSL